MIYLTIFITILMVIYFYWRFFFFFRDPDRKVPDGENIVSPADGTIVYIKKIDNDITPISIKNKKEIRLEEVTKYKDDLSYPRYHIGIFMHPTDIHVNRAPISGKIKKIIYSNSNNLPMTMMWWRILLGMRPYELYSDHIIQNERNTLMFDGVIPVSVIQIADIYVNKIECWVKENQEIKKGERIGMIKMGSQVDLIFPSESIREISINIGQKVKSGETVIALLK
ncbi:MAG TPA: phosphatidylserine decarboxylase [Candidatus Paceibacterota bacterium]